MALRGPIILIEDDASDADAIKSAIQELGPPNEVILFETAKAAHDYLLTTTDKPLVIMCDVRMPAIDGLTLLKQIQSNEYLRLKAIPFVFLSGIATQKIIDEAYRLSVQGFYLKPAGYVALRDIVRTILTYWLASQHPSAQPSNTAS